VVEKREERGDVDEKENRRIVEVSLFLSTLGILENPHKRPKLGPQQRREGVEKVCLSVCGCQLTAAFAFLARFVEKVEPAKAVACAW
jgi:hypothetical protein